MGPCSWCLVWDDPRPGHAMQCFIALEKVLSFPPDSGFSQMGAHMGLFPSLRV